jgi:hypothetical protein
VDRPPSQDTKPLTTTAGGERWISLGVLLHAPRKKHRTSCMGLVAPRSNQKPRPPARYLKQQWPASPARWNGRGFFFLPFFPCVGRRTQRQGPSLASKMRGSQIGNGTELLCILGPAPGI